MTSEQVIPEAAVETAAEWLPHSGDCEVRPERDCTCWKSRVNLMRAALEAAAPHMVVPTKPKLGEGDYLPGWDDRKTLAELWQQHAALPEGGLREGTYDALIAIAAWGYQQRKDEEL